MVGQARDGNVYEFGAFRLEPAELLFDGKPIHLEKRHIAVLRALVRKSQKVVTYDQLLKEAWGRIVELNNVSGCVSFLRKTLRALDSSQRYIHTVPGVGYRFALPHSIVSDVSPAVPGITIDIDLLRCLNASRMQCIKHDVPFRTPNVLLMLLDMAGGYAEKLFSAAKLGFGGVLREKLRPFATERQVDIDRKKGLRYEDFDWFEIEYIQKAAEEAKSEGCPVIMEKHLLLGVLQSTSSRTVKWLRAQMSEIEFETLKALARADSRTPISEDSVL